MCNVANSLKAEQKIQNLERLFKKRRRDESILKTAKTLLVHGHSPGKVALLLRLDPDFVVELAKTWNPQFRRVAYTSQWTMKHTVREYFDSGAMLETICTDLQLPLFSVVQFLERDGITPQQMQARWPEHDNQLVIEFRKTVQRHTHRKQKPPRLH